jgi:hypothetical protein
MHEMRKRYEAHEERTDMDEPQQNPVQVIPTSTLEPELIKGEKHLEALGLFSPSTKRNKRGGRLTRKKVKVFEKDGVKIKVEITFMGVEGYGLPIVSDLDIFRAFQKIVTEQFQQDGEIEIPIAFTAADIRRVSGKTHGWFDIEVKEWIKRMVLTGIEAEQTVWHAGKQEWLSGVFHVFTKGIAKGEKLGDGRIADKYYVWLEDWYLQNFNFKLWKYIDYDLHKNLKTSIAKVLYPILDAMFYAGGGNPVSKRYDDLCDELDITRYRYLSDIQKRFDPALEDLRVQGYLAKWEYAKTQDDRGYKITFWPGKRYFLIHGNRLKGETSSTAPGQITASATVSQKTSRSTGKRSTTPIPKQAEFITWLESKGVKGARKLVMSSPHRENPEMFEVIRLDFERRNAKGKIDHPKAWLSTVVSDPGYNRPKGLETNKEKEKKEEQNAISEHNTQIQLQISPLQKELKRIHIWLQAETRERLRFLKSIEQYTFGSTPEEKAERIKWIEANPAEAIAQAEAKNERRVKEIQTRIGELQSMLKSSLS